MSVEAAGSGRVATHGEAQRNRQLLHATEQFERMLLRSMLTQVEKSAHFGGTGTSGGSSVYSSMIVDALADAVANAGGLGLAKKLAADLQGFHSKL